MNAFVAFISRLIAEILAIFAKDRGKAVESDRDPDVLRRAGSRVRGWVQQDSFGSGVKPDPGGPVRKDAGLHAQERRVDPVGQQGDGS